MRTKMEILDKLTSGARSVLLSGLFDVRRRTEEGRTVYDLIGVYCIAGMTLEELDEELGSVHETIMTGSAAVDAAAPDLFS